MPPYRANIVMKVVALISGGKDSFYSIVECHRMGHEVVALANLHPPSTSGDEMDSFCFQTVGHDVIEGYAECLGVPLIRQEIRGLAVNQELGYVQTQGDEVKRSRASLMRLLECFINHGSPH